MALDTADKRASSFGIGLPFFRVGPAPDGAFSTADRYHLAYSYRGITGIVFDETIGAGQTWVFAARPISWAMSTRAATWILSARPISWVLGVKSREK